MLTERHRSATSHWTASRDAADADAHKLHANEEVFVEQVDVCCDTAAVEHPIAASPAANTEGDRATGLSLPLLIYSGMLISAIHSPGNNDVLH